MLAHETAHQWWGDAVDWESYRDQWIIEALANYSALVMLERSNPEKMKLALNRYRDDLLRATPNGPISDAGPVTLGQRLTSSRFPQAFEPVLYGRGTWLIHTLRSMMREASGGQNDALFFGALKGLLAKAPNGKISTRDLQHAFEEVLPPALAYEGQKSLDWFFDSWVNGASIPQFTLSDVHITPSGSQVKVRGIVRQSFADKNMVTAMPVYGVNKDGHSYFISFVFVDEPDQEFQLSAPAGTTGILLDPQGSVLRR
jgi:aminopeptidase N